MPSDSLDPEPSEAARRFPPGTITRVDFRDSSGSGSGSGADASISGADASSSGADVTRPLRLLTWNIERGYELARVIEELKAAGADIISLQELDIGCDRSGGADTFSAIGAALRLDGLFLSEFEELRSPLRPPRAQGGGVHGNALFSRFGWARWRVLEHSHHPVDWGLPPSAQPHALAAREPRRGRRAVLVGEAPAPKGAVRVYNLHLEVFCGVLGRAAQFADVWRDVAAAPLAPPGRCAILGDLNTMANGVARLSRHYCCDALRWRTLGWSEAEYWARHVFGCRAAAGADAATDAAAAAPVAAPSSSAVGGEGSGGGRGAEPPPSQQQQQQEEQQRSPPINEHFAALGLPRSACAALVNPGFVDPFDPRKDVTLDNPTYRLGPLHLMAGKLDWALVKGLAPRAWRMGNLGYAASDHRYLLVEAE